ncbi:DMT family transporter [Thalassospira alkalitolerans]|uniref:DMT family transporter n=1 Tax=Thalassospira alkalitolerans TaxID=1293890 RepID=UPI0030EDBAB0|tara:strand:- start:85150 stop:86172 length:1023 start_codon:yes stop_codon:yes gene_type:complete
MTQAMHSAGSTSVAPSATTGMGHGQSGVLPLVQSTIWAVVALAVSAILMGLGPVFVRFSGVSPDASAFWRVALSAPLLGAVVFLMPAGSSSRFLDRPITPLSNRVGRLAGVLTGRGDAGLMILAGLLFAGDLVTCHMAIEMTTVGNAILLNNLAPVIIGLLGLFGVARKPGVMFWCGVPFAIIGGYFLFRASDAGAGSMRGDAFAVLAAFFYAGYLIVIARLRRHHNAASIMFWSTLTTVVALGIMMAIKGNFVLPPDITGWLSLLALAVLVHALGQGLVSVGLKRVDEATGSMILLLQPFVASILGAVILGEMLNQWHIMGSGSVIVALLIATRRRRTL